MTQLDIVIETILHYTVEGNPLSVTPRGCVYNGPDGAKCAFARVCKEDVNLSLYEGKTASTILESRGYSIIQDKYLNDTTENIAFWVVLQRIHDHVLRHSHEASSIPIKISSLIQGCKNITFNVKEFNKRFEEIHKQLVPFYKKKREALK